MYAGQYVFAQVIDFLHVFRCCVAQQWSGWNAFAATGHPVQLALDYNADGRLTLFSHWLLSGGQFGGLWCVSQMNFDSTEWELSWNELAPGDIKQYAVVRDLTPPT